MILHQIFLFLILVCIYSLEHFVIYYCIFISQDSKFVGGSQQISIKMAETLGGRYCYILDIGQTLRGRYCYILDIGQTLRGRYCYILDIGQSKDLFLIKEKKRSRQ